MSFISLYIIENNEGEFRGNLQKEVMPLLQIYLGMVDDYEDKLTVETLYHKYYKMMFYAAFDVLQSEEDAEDAVHDSFVLISRNIKQVSALETDEIYPYILTIVRNKAIDIYRQNRKRQRNKEIFVKNDMKDDEDFFEQIDYNELLKAITELPAVYRDIMYLFYVKGMSAKDISKKLKITVNAVWQRNSYAKKLLREKLKEFDIYV